MPVAKKKRKANKFILLKKAKARHCRVGSSASRKSLTNAKKNYIKSAIKGGKTRAQATRIANKVVNAGCSA